MNCLDSIHILIILLTIFRANLSMSVTILDKRYSWEQASKSCILLGSNNLGEVQIQKINISKDIPGELYWIGAINQSIWFEYQGDQRRNCRVAQLTSVCPSNPCNFDCTEQISDDDGQCFCKEDGNPTTRFVSQYMRWFTPPSNINGSIRGDCVAFTKTAQTGYHEVLPCSTQLSPICSNGFNPAIQPCDWFQAVRLCNSRPISSFNDLLRYDIATEGQGWTGIRRITVLKWSGSVDSDTLFDCLAVNITSMSLVQVSCDTELPSLCENGSISTTSVNEGIGFDGSINEGQTVKFNALAVGLVFGGVLFGTLIAMGVVLVKRRKQTKMRKTSATFHNSNYETAMDATIPAEYAEVNYDVTSPGNARTDDTYDHARIQSLGRVLVDRREVFGPSSVQGLDDDYDHIP
ncbi:uncharacterized protein LOC111121367 isoform X2 [Crassostrea virginica]